MKIVIFLVKNGTNGEIHVSDKLEQVEFKLEKNLGLRNMQEKLKNTISPF